MKQFEQWISQKWIQLTKTIHLNTITDNLEEKILRKVTNIFCLTDVEEAQIYIFDIQMDENGLIIRFWAILLTKIIPKLIKNASENT